MANLGVNREFSTIDDYSKNRIAEDEAYKQSMDELEAQRQQSIANQQMIEDEREVEELKKSNGKVGLSDEP